MGICSEWFSMFNVYWKNTRKWFFVMVAGLAAIELGLLLYYVNGGYLHMYITDGNSRRWPMEYGGALQSIRLDYIVPVFLVTFVFFLILSYSSFFSLKTLMLTQRLPISLKMQILTQIGYSLLMLLSFWLIQFLIIIAGFLIYRYSAPDGLMIDVQIFKIFWYPGLVAKLYPFLNMNYLGTWLVCLGCLSVLPSYISYRVRVMEHYFIWSVVKLAVGFLALSIVRAIYDIGEKTIIYTVVIFLFSLVMIRYLFFRDVHLKRSKTK